MSSAEMRHGIDLASEADFRLGNLRVSPSTSRVSANAVETRVEPRIMQVLVTLAKAPERLVTREQLVAACWNGRVVSDDAITRAIAKLRQLAQTGGQTHFSVETVPKLGFRLVPANVVVPEQADPITNQPPAIQASLLRSLWPSRAKAITAAIALAVALIVLLLAMMQRAGAPEDGKAAAMGEIQVSSFGALGTDPELAQLSVATRDAIAPLLAAYGLQARVGEGGEAAKSSAGLEVTGSASREGAYYVLRAQIARKPDKVILWSRGFETTNAKGVGLDAEAASAIAAVLNCGLRQGGAAPAVIEKFLADILNACTATFRTDQPAVDATTRLIAAAPDDVGVLSLRAFVLARRTEEIDIFRREELAMNTEARQAADRAIALNPNAVLALIALGFRLGEEPRFAERERALRRVMSLAPNSQLARVAYIKLLREVGRLRAAAEIGQSLETEPDRRLQTAPQLALLYAIAGDLPDALRTVDRMDVVRPADARTARWTIAFWWQDPRLLNDEFWHGLGKELPEAYRRCMQKYVEGLTQADSGMRGLPPECATMEPDWRIRMLAREGDVDGAYAMMQGELPNSRNSTMFVFYPEMKAFRQDKRFLTLASRMGLMNYWRQTENWPDFCQLEGCPMPEAASGANR